MPSFTSRPIRLLSIGLSQRAFTTVSDGPPSEARFSYPRVARFVVRGGREVRIAPDPHGDPAIYRLYVQGMMFEITAAKDMERAPKAWGNNGP